MYVVYVHVSFLVGTLKHRICGVAGGGGELFGCSVTTCLYAKYTHVRLSNLGLGQPD